MANNVQANWNVVQIVYGNASEPMVDRKQIHFFHYNQSMDRHTKQ
jgi:hypothetical protein